MAMPANVWPEIFMDGLKTCFERNPARRPTFSALVRRLQMALELLKVNSSDVADSDGLESSVDSLLDAEALARREQVAAEPLLQAWQAPYEEPELAEQERTMTIADIVAEELAMMEHRDLRPAKQDGADGGDDVDDYDCDAYDDDDDDTRRDFGSVSGSGSGAGTGSGETQDTAYSSGSPTVYKNNYMLLDVSVPRKSVQVSFVGGRRMAAAKAAAGDLRDEEHEFGRKPRGLRSDSPGFVYGYDRYFVGKKLVETSIL